MKSYILNLYRDNVIINRFAKVFSVDILVKASSFILLPIYLRLMTQKEYGLYSYLTSIVVTFAMLLNFGLYISQSKIYQDLKSHEEKGALIYTIHITLLVLLAPLLLIIYGFDLDYKLISLLFKDPINYHAYRSLILIAIIASIYSFMLFNYFLTSEQIRHVQRYNILRLIIINTLSLSLLYFIKGDAVYNRMASTYGIEFILAATFFYLYVGKAMHLRFDRHLMSRSLKLGLPVMAAAICDLMINFSDKFFLERDKGLTDLSIYYLACNTAIIIPLLFNTLQNIWLPIFLKEKDLQKNLNMTKKLIKLLSIALAVLSAGIWILMKVIIVLGIISPKYSSVMFVLPLILLSQSLISVCHLMTNYITYFEQTYLIPIFSAFIGICCLAFNIVFIPTYGVYGAAFSVLATNIVYFVVYYIVLKWNIRKVRERSHTTYRIS